MPDNLGIPVEWAQEGEEPCNRAALGTKLELLLSSRKTRSESALESLPHTRQQSRSASGDSVQGSVNISHRHVSLQKAARVQQHEAGVGTRPQQRWLSLSGSRSSGTQCLMYRPSCSAATTGSLQNTTKPKTTAVPEPRAISYHQPGVLVVRLGLPNDLGGQH